jgi:hypothetical protein
VVAIVGAVLVGVIAAPAGIYRWLSVVLAVTVLLTFIIQLALPGHRSCGRYRHTRGRRRVGSSV